MDNWVRHYAAKERQRTETLENLLKPFGNALMRQIEADVAVFREEFPKSGHDVTVEIEAGRIQRGLGFNNVATVLITLRADGVLWEYKGANVGGKPGQFVPRTVEDSVSQVSETILKPVLFPALYAEERTRSQD